MGQIVRRRWPYVMGLLGVWCVVLIMPFLSGCTKDDTPISKVQGHNLVFRIAQVKPTEVRAATETGEDAENAIAPDKLWLFVMKRGEDNMILSAKAVKNQDGSYSVPVEENEAAALRSGNKFDIYLVANVDFTRKPQTRPELTQATSQRTDLNNLTHNTFRNIPMLGLKTDIDIHYPQSKDLGMIDLKRIVAKIDVQLPNVKIYNGDDDYVLASDPEVRLENFTDRGYLIEHQQKDEWVKTSPQFYKISLNQGSASLYSFLYNFGAAAKEKIPKLLLKVVLKPKNDSSDPGEAYFYSIPIHATDNTLKQNYLYKVQVTLKRFGSKDRSNPVEVDGNSVLVGESQYGGGGNTDLSDPKYFFFAEHRVRMARIEEYSVNYRSSSPIKNIEVKQCYFDYVDSDGNPRKDEVDNNDNQYPLIESYANGVVKIHSLLPINNIPKTFVISAINDDGIADEFEVVQYPDEYIEYTWGIKSSWTTKLAPGLNNKAMYYIRTLSLPDKFKDKLLGFPNKYSRGIYSWDYSWSSKRVSDKGEIVIAKQDTINTPNLISPSFELASQLGATIALTYADYLKDGLEQIVLVKDIYNGVKSEQALKYYNYDITKSYALLVCANYSETKEDGKTVRNWRLPTVAEIKLIDYLQDQPKGAVKRIMTGPYYWATNGTAVEISHPIPYNSRDYIDDKRRVVKAHVRCVRDVKEYDF